MERDVAWENAVYIKIFSKLGERCLVETSFPADIVVKEKGTDKILWSIDVGKSDRAGQYVNKIVAWNGDYYDDTDDSEVLRVYEFDTVEALIRVVSRGQ